MSLIIDWALFIPLDVPIMDAVSVEGALRGRPNGNNSRCSPTRIGLIRLSMGIVFVYTAFLGGPLVSGAPLADWITHMDVPQHGEAYDGIFIPNTKPGAFHLISSADDRESEDLVSNNEEDVRITSAIEPWSINKRAWANQGYRIQSKSILVEGDIAMPIQPPRLKRAVRKTSQSRWPDRTVPFVIDHSLSLDVQTEIMKAINHWMRNTCLVFRQKQTSDQDYIRFVSDKGCWSYVGRQGGEQNVSIGEGCNIKGTIVHEIGHVIGFWHEHSRSDRDLYVKIIRSNIHEDAMSQFEYITRPLIDSMGFAYDFWSVMHYGPYYFSKNNKKTIRIRKMGQGVGAIIGQRKALSYLDVAQVNQMYKCHEKQKKDDGCFASQSGRGTEYRGKRSYSISNVTCQHWSVQYPHKHDTMTGVVLLDRADGISNHNYCRNPGGLRDRPWCYTTKIDTEWEYCDIQLCNDNVDWSQTRSPVFRQLRT